MSALPFAVRAACLRGVEAQPVAVEVSLAGGIPGIQIVGLADAAVLEARSRIRCALRSAGFSVPRQSITVNLAPGDVRKTGTGFELPIAVAILAASAQIPSTGLSDVLLVGELGLDGSVCPTRGNIAYQLLARQLGVTLVGAWDSGTAALDGARQVRLTTLGNLKRGIERATEVLPESPRCEPGSDESLDYRDVVGQETAKRAMAIAAAGEHAVLMIGAPGSGKTMLARRLPSILPPLDAQARQEALCIHSVAGERIERLLAGSRPFRSPHHSISSAGLIGGGRPPRPGEISLAHGGVLFLDELAEFAPSVLQSLRQPMEDGFVNIVRADGLYRFPSAFQFIAASNPCPCGYLGDREASCTCSPTAVERYQSRIGGPVRDRIDIVLDVMRPDPDAVIRGEEGLSSKDLSEQVIAGRSYRQWRERRRGIDKRARRASDPSVEGLVAAYGLDDGAAESALSLARTAHLTARGLTRLCRVARTIADMDASERVTGSHVLEASMFRGRG